MSVALSPWGSNVIIEVSSAAPDADPVWVDISEWVTGFSGMTLETNDGRATELDTSEPGRFQLALRNRDRRFTVGNPSSPYFPWWKQCRRIRGRDVYGWRAFPLFDAFLEIPDNTIDYQVIGDPDANIAMTVTGVDCIARAASRRTFLSTLAAMILGTADDTGLVAYWPMVGGRSTTSVLAELGGPALSASTVVYDASVPAGTLVSAGTGAPLPGDDANPLHFAPNQKSDGQAAAGVYFAAPGSYVNTGPTTVSGQALTVTLWFRGQQPSTIAVPNNFSTVPLLIVIRDGNTLADVGSYEINWSGPAASGTLTGGVRLFTIGGAATTLSASNTDFPDQSAIMVSLQLYPATNTVSFWVNGTSWPVTVGGSALPATLRNTGLTVNELGKFFGDIAHLQVRVHDPAAFTFADHLAQWQVGLYGLENQFTGARVGTIADWTGVPAFGRDIDPGVAAMSKVTLAGRTAGDAWAEAVATERGRLFTRDGRLVFHDRRRVYNI